MIKEKDRKFSIGYYLKDKNHKVQIKRMMKDLFKGKHKTLKEWERIDETINKRSV